MVQLDSTEVSTRGPIQDSSEPIQRFKNGDTVVLVKGEHGFKRYIGQELMIVDVDIYNGITDEKERLYVAVASDGKRLIFIPDSFMEFVR